MFRHYLGSNSPSHRTNVTSMQRNFEALQKVVDNGLSQMNAYTTEATFGIWLSYSQQIVNLVFQDKANVYLNYMNFCNTLQASRLLPHEKMSQAIKYLLELMRFV